jgi:DNA-binding transcriptional ArsR family regulator
MVLPHAEPVSDAVFRALADPTRREILRGLALGPERVTEICARFSISQPSISAHLEVLRGAGLVSVRIDGRNRIYALAPERLAHVSDWLAELEGFWRGRLDALGAHLARRAGAATSSPPARSPRARTAQSQRRRKGDSGVS